MNISVEAQNLDLAPHWKRQLEERLTDWSDPRDPVINARSTFCFRSKEIPPAEVTLVLSMRGKNIVVSKRADSVDAALNRVLDTTKREIRRFYDLRSDKRRGNGVQPPFGAAESPPAGGEMEAELEMD
jgi:ribosome-associated translation inhibitor RaiA